MLIQVHNEMFGWMEMIADLVLDGVSVLNHFWPRLKILLEDVGVCGLDSLVVILFKVHDLEAELLVKLDGAFVVHLDVSKM